VREKERAGEGLGSEAWRKGEMRIVNSRTQGRTPTPGRWDGWEPRTISTKTARSMREQGRREPVGGETRLVRSRISGP